MNSRALVVPSPTMRAVVQDKYGPHEEVLRVEVVPRPVPGDDEVLFRVCAASVHPDVWHVVSGYPLIARMFGAGVRRPKTRIPGIDAAGIVEAVGKNVRGFSLGDEVFGETHHGFQWKHGGAFAEYVAAPAENLRHKPHRISFAEAASVPTSGMIALFNFPRENVFGAGRRVLVNGAGGGVGSSALQIAKAKGAHVTAVDFRRKEALVRSLGADSFIDCETENFLHSGAPFDLIYDVASNLDFSRCKDVLTADGKYIVIGHDHFGAREGRVWGTLPQVLGLALRTPFNRHLSAGQGTKFDKGAMMAELCTLLESGRLTPIIDKSFSLDEAAMALSYLASGKAMGRVVISP